RIQRKSHLGGGRGGESDDELEPISEFRFVPSEKSA
ncbi:putative Methylosome subunit pICln-like protein, partial [Naja naja]